MTRASLIAAGLLVSASLPGVARAGDPATQPQAIEEGGTPAAAPAGAAATADTLCTVMKAVAEDRGLPFDFFARLIWRESRFRADVTGPRTRSGQRALGIAQFMPATAVERGLADPFDPREALPKSAEFLARLRADFGNLGLAAAAYNAGPGRVRGWMNGTSSLPGETRRYVRAITGRSADEWVAIGRADPAMAAERTPSCDELLLAMRAPPLPAPVAQGVPPSPPRIAAAARPWGVQLAAGFSRDQVLTSFSRLAKKFEAALAGTDASLVRSTQRSRGTHAFYQIRLGAETRAEADHICARLKAAGGACLVMRNPTAPVEPI